MIYYNPAVFTPPKTATLCGIREVPADDPFYKYDLQNAVESEAAAAARNVSGIVKFKKDGKLYRASSTGSWEFKPLVEEPSYIPGINWCSAYFLTEEKAREWAKGLGDGQQNIRVHSEYGVTEVHYHL